MGFESKKFLPLFLCWLLASCGGGGAGVSGGVTTDDRPPPKPPIPKAIYSGNRSLAVVDTTTALTFERDFSNTVLILQDSNKYFPDNAAARLDETDKGLRGTVRIQGTVESDGTGWVEYQYSSYTPFDSTAEVRNGSLILYKTSALDVTVAYKHYQTTLFGGMIEFNGTVATHQADEFGAVVHDVANISLTDNTGSILATDFTIRSNAGDALEITGRLYDSTAGYVNVSTPIPFTDLTSEGDGPENLVAFGKGEVKMSGLNDNSLHIEPLNNYFEYIGLDTDGDGNIEQGARLVIGTHQLDQIQPTDSTVSALASLQSEQEFTGDSASLDGRFSYTQNGFVRYDWKLISAPLGSNAQMTDSGPTTQFTMDSPGDYLVQLTATAGGVSASDLMVISYDGASFGNDGIGLYKVQGFSAAHVGDQVSLDARASPILPGGSSFDNLWVLQAPSGSHATIEQDDNVLTSFTPDIPGIYYVRLGVGNPGYGASNVEVISVDENVRFAPPALIFSDNSINAMETGSFGGVGDGLAFTRSDFLRGDRSIKWLQPARDGLFANGGEIPLSNGETDGLLVTDLNGDGISDFVTPEDNTVSDCPLEFRQSNLGSYMLSSTAFGPACNSYFNVVPARSAVIGGHAAVVEDNDSYGASSVPTFAVFVRDSSGNMQAPVLITANGAHIDDEILDFRLQDVDGDGEMDLVAVVITGTISPSGVVEVYHGVGDGSFTYLASYALNALANLSVSAAPLQIGDLNGDGKPDIAVAFGKTLNIYYGDGSGSFSSMPDTRTISCLTNSLGLRDVNGDGYLDLLTTDEKCGTGNGVTVLGLYLSDNSGSLGEEQFYPLLNPYSAGGMRSAGELGDFNGDGLQDVMYSDGGNLLFIPALAP